MKLAIAVFGDRVSPRFDCAASFLVVTVVDDAIIQRCDLSAADWTPHDRVHRLVATKVDAVVCGGIDRWSAESLQEAGVALYAWVAGTIEESLEKLIRGDLAVN